MPVKSKISKLLAEAVAEEIPQTLVPELEKKQGELPPEPEVSTGFVPRSALPPLPKVTSSTPPPAAKTAAEDYDELWLEMLDQVDAVAATHGLPNASGRPDEWDDASTSHVHPATPAPSKTAMTPGDWDEEMRHLDERLAKTKAALADAEEDAALDAEMLRLEKQITKVQEAVARDNSEVEPISTNPNDPVERICDVFLHRSVIKDLMELMDLIGMPFNPTNMSDQAVVAFTGQVYQKGFEDGWESYESHILDESATGLDDSVNDTPVYE